MAQPTVLMKTVMIILSMNLILYTSGVRVIGTTDTTKNTLERFVDINNINESENRTVSVDESLKENTRVDVAQSGSGSGNLNFLDSLASVSDFAAFIVNITFTPVGLFSSIGMPVEITLLLGVPLLFMAISGFLYFIRSGK